MTRNDHQLIADAIKQVEPADYSTTEDVKRELVDAIAGELSRDNPRFDYARFKAACYEIR